MRADIWALICLLWLVGCSNREVVPNNSNNLIPLATSVTQEKSARGPSLPLVAAPGVTLSREAAAVPTLLGPDQPALSTNSEQTDPPATPSPQPTAIPVSNGPVTIQPDDPGVSYIGRFNKSDRRAPTFDWPGVAIEAAFSGPALTILLEDGNNLYNLYIDGVPSILSTFSGESSYPVATGLGDGRHTVRLVKRTEYDGAVATFHGFHLPQGGGLQSPPPRPSRRIEVIGDSISTGYGVEGESPTCAYSSATQNIERTYGALLGQQFGAEIMTTAISGIGVIRNYREPDMISAQPMTARYERAIADDPTTFWEFETWRPDVIVINLGTNDFSTDPQPSREIFVQAYIDLLNSIRSHYPLTPILAMSPPIIQEPAAFYIDTAVTYMNTVQNDANVHFFNIPALLVIPDDYGCEYHPNVAGQEKIAGQLIPVIQELMGW